MMYSVVSVMTEQEESYIGVWSCKCCQCCQIVTIRLANLNLKGFTFFIHTIIENQDSDWWVSLKETKLRSLVGEISFAQIGLYL